MKKRIAYLGTMRMLANKERYLITGETFGGIKDVKLHSLEAVFTKNFAKHSSLFSKYTASNEAAAILPYTIIQILVFGGMILSLLAMLGAGKELGEIIPTLGLLAFAGLKIIPKFQTIYQSLARIRFGTPSVTILKKHLAMEEAEPPMHVVPLPLIPERYIALESVTFRYPNTEAVAVADLSLTIPVNSTIGLVGASGAGKTTAIDLLLALYAPQEGQLRVDDTTITADNRRAWQRSIGYVPQDIFLLDASVRENIAFGIPEDEIDDAAVEHAAKQANLHEFVTTQLQEGYATRVGERGIRLSGGQKQRIGIARALYRQPSVLVFDEATSAVDNVTEREIVAALTSLGGQKTIIMIAHRLDTVRHCDCIYLMERGKVVASGTFDELAASEKRFQNMLGNSISL
jgi:ATP-binding cassette, subfamily B, bacterial PglK